MKKIFLTIMTMTLASNAFAGIESNSSYMCPNLTSLAVRCKLAAKGNTAGTAELFKDKNVFGICKAKTMAGKEGPEFITFPEIKDGNKYTILDSSKDEPQFSEFNLNNSSFLVSRQIDENGYKILLRNYNNLSQGAGYICEKTESAR